MAWPQHGTWDLVEGSAWAGSKQKLRDAMKAAGKAALVNEIRAAQVVSKRVIEEKLNKHPWAGEKLIDPPERTDPQNPFAPWGKGSRAWVQSVVQTLAEQYGIDIDRGGTSRLMQAVAEVYDPVDSGSTIVVGYAPRSELDRMTGYVQRIILQSHRPTPDDRGRKSWVSTLNRTSVEHPQLIWWNWDSQKWESASVVAYPDGTTKVMFGGAGKQLQDWRGSIPSGSGYWADQEFGTMATQIPAQFIPQKGADYTMLFLSQQGISLSQMTPTAKRGKYGIKPTLYLAAGAEQLVERLYRTSASKDAWRNIVRAKMGGSGS